MSALRSLAPAKVNLGLWLGPLRASDGRHEIVTVMQSISLADELTLESLPPGARADEVICPGVPGGPEENLAALALRAFRELTGAPRERQRLSIVKHTPVAAGLAGGSADAAATLRLLHRATGAGDLAQLDQIARALGADVPAQLEPGRWLASGAGERLERLPDPVQPVELALLAQRDGLSTAAVYRQADGLGMGRTQLALEQRLARLRDALAQGQPLPDDPDLLDNDLQRAACTLHAGIEPELQRARASGAEHVFLAGSGPTVVALFAPPHAARRADRAAQELSGGLPALRARSVGADFGAVVSVGV